MQDYPGQVVLPVQIRPEVKVWIGNIPHDLKKAEAERIAAIVLAYGNKERAHD